MKLLFERILFPPQESVRTVFHRWSQIVCPYHYHPEVEIVAIHKSNGGMCIGDYQGTFESGDLFLIGSNLPHVFYNGVSHRSAADAAQVTVVQFNDFFLGKKSSEIPELAGVVKSIRLAKQCLKFTGKGKAAFLSKVNALTRLHGAKRIASLIEILDEWSHPKNHTPLLDVAGTPENQFQNDPRIVKILQYMQSHLRERIQLSALAKHISMAESSVCRLFKSKMGISLMDYLCAQRIALSCQLLIETDRKIVDICFEVGFENLSNYNRHFIKRKLCTPSEYRRFHQNNALPITEPVSD